MKLKINHILFVFFLLLGFTTIAQNKVWKKIKNNTTVASSDIYFRKSIPSEFKKYTIEITDFKNDLATKSKGTLKIIELPTAAGNIEKFYIKETSTLAPELTQKFPMIKSYSAQGIDDPTAVAKISFGTNGMHVMILSGIKETVYIDPYTKSNKQFIVYKRNAVPNFNDFECLVDEPKVEIPTNITNARNANDGKLRTFRLALACSGEYAQFHLTQQNVSGAATDAVKKAAILSAMNTSMTRINGVFERDLSVTMVIVANNENIIFLDAATDGITDGTPSTMIDEVQSICDTQIGDANYDIGHVFSIGGDGLAGGGVVCLTGQKARGVTGRSSPIGDPYDIDYVAHEMGHQFGANHTQNNSCNRNDATAVEPGSASTIMGYAGICAPNVQGASDDHFHAVSIAEMWNTIQSSATCGVETNTNNTAPTANAGLDYSIPKSTPFILKGTATDIDGMESLTYNWEQIDAEIATMPPAATSIDGPVFRSFPSATSPNRYMPKLATVISGNTSSTWEVVPSVARDMNFSFVVRDNHAGGGSTARDDVQITVTNADAFTVSAPNTAVTWNAGTTQTITWNKGTTDAAPINCQNVTIKLSTDGGVTFPITLLANTPNDGSQTVTIPNNATTSARIMVAATDNVFYNVNSTNFTINSTTPTFIVTNTSGTEVACNSGGASVSYNLNFDFVNGFSETVSFSTTGHPTGATVSFNPSTINSNGTITMTVNNFNGVTAQLYTIDVAATANTVTQHVDAVLNVQGSTFNTITLTEPTDTDTGIALTPILKWQADNNASSYDVQVASDNGFTTIVASSTVVTNEYTVNPTLSATTQFYWRIKPKNDCGDGSFSAAFSFTTLNPIYCKSIFAQATGSEYISNVTFNTINNNSDNDYVTNSPSGDGYENFTAITTNIKRDDTHEISVTFDTAGFQDHCYVFIDWNQDYIFNTTNERYDLGTKLEDTATATFNITVPSDATLGNTRMRVLIEYDDPNSNFGEGPCTGDFLSGWGETEDYTLIIEEATASIEDYAFSGFNLYPNPSNGEFTLNFEVVNTDKVTIQLFDIRGRLINEKNFRNTKTRFSESFNYNKASKGLYMLKITNGNKQTTRKIVIQ